MSNIAFVRMSDQIIVLPDNTAYLAGAKAAVTFANSAQMFEYKDLELLPFQKNKKKYRGIVPWGDDNDLPDKIIESVYKNPVMTSGMLFNIQIGYGDGIIPPGLLSRHTQK